MSLNTVTLEMSLKPFRDPTNIDAVEAICHKAFTQWNTLCQHADHIQILLWPADGSEILAYKGNLDEAFEWAYWLGFANPSFDVPNDPKKEALHSTPQLYMENPPKQTYRTLAGIVKALKKVGQQVTGKPIKVGATFDPGGEFARSTFKYKEHPEICIANTMGINSFVGCYATLDADATSYAGFPQGIPQDTTFGTFFGKQTQAFLKDMDCDYIWFSNGFGFGLETWSTVGPLFDGNQFDAKQAPDIRNKILNFWEDFRKQCPDYPIETRGTNLGTGTDLASDAVPLREIYESGFNMYTPPNSPWAAIDGDFGLELMGYMSRIAELPTGHGFPFRFYVHDPWWINSPWLDRYGRDAHDIFLPMSIARIDDHGQIETHETLQFLTIDDSYGKMPESCPNEIIPLLLRCMDTKPDMPGIVTWVYPFDTFHDYVDQSPERLNTAYFSDWFIRGAINNGMPVNTVVSDRSLLASLNNNTNVYDKTILLSLVPDAKSDLEKALLKHMDHGGKVLFYGSTQHASEQMRSRLNLQLGSPLKNEVQVNLTHPLDRVTQGQLPTTMIHRSQYSGGPMCEELHDKTDANTQILATANGKPIAIKTGNIAWVRGSNCTDMSQKPKLPTVDDPTQYFHGDLLLRHALDALGVHVSFTRRDLSHRNPVLSVSRHANALWFACYSKNSSVQWQLGYAEDGGMPVMVQCDAVIENGKAVYQMPRAWRRECRVLVQQNSGVVSCSEEHSGHVPVKRRLKITGLENATVTFLPEPGYEENTTFQINAPRPLVIGPFASITHGENHFGKTITAEDLTGELMISW